MRTAFVVLALAIATPAHAEQVGVVVTGEATLQPQVASGLEIWLHARGRSISAGALEPTAINTLIDCFVLEDLGCARGLIDARSKAPSIIYARIDQTQTDDGMREVAITAYWFQKSHEPIGERRICLKCTDEKLHATLDEVMLALVHSPPLPAAAAAAEPPPQETAPAEEASPAPAPVDEARPRTSFVPLGLVAAGGVALVAGGVLVAIDQDPDPVGPQERTYRNTATAGVVIGFAGAAAVAAGVYLWMQDHEHGAPVAAVTHDTAVVGWTGRF
jgi:hypothetical protein